MTSNDLGSYNEATRMKEVFNRLDNSFAQFRKKMETPNSNGSSPNVPKSSGNRKSIQLTALEEKAETIRQLEEKIQKFPPGHFTQEYRVLREECVKLQMELDKLDHFENDNIRKKRKEAICRVEEALNSLYGKTHESGKACPECEIQNPMAGLESTRSRESSDVPA